MNDMAAANQSLQQQLVDAQNQPVAEVAEQVVVTDANMLRVPYSSQSDLLNCHHVKR